MEVKLHEQVTNILKKQGYILEKLLGQGTFGTVFIATKTVKGQKTGPFALKIAFIPQESTEELVREMYISHVVATMYPNHLVAAHHLEAVYLPDLLKTVLLMEMPLATTDLASVLKNLHRMNAVQLFRILWG